MAMCILSMKEKIEDRILIHNGSSFHKIIIETSNIIMSTTLQNDNVKSSIEKLT